MNRWSTIPRDALSHAVGHERRRIAYSQRYDELVASFEGAPLDVSFRELAGPMSTDSDAQRLHPYPAKLLRHIPHFLLGCEQIASQQDIVADPFCGSGTTLDEAVRWGLGAVGMDINPLAILITANRVSAQSAGRRQGALNDCVDRAKSYRERSHPFGQHVDYWFGPQTARALSHLRRAIDCENDRHLRRFLMLVLSLTVNAVAWKDSRLPVPVRPKTGELPAGDRMDVIETYHRLGESADLRLSRIHRHQSGHVHSIELGDAVRDVGRLSPRPDLILTSPPYGAAQKYARFSGHSLSIVDLATAKDIRDLSYRMVGRERVAEFDAELEGLPEAISSRLDRIRTLNPSRARIYGAYFSEMFAFLQRAAELIRPDKPIVLVSSENTVAGEPLATHALLYDLATASGFQVELILRDRILARALLTKRAESAGKAISHEYVYILRKTVV